MLAFFAVILLASFAANGAYMLISPRAWFRLPKWLGAHGTLTEEKYGDGWGAIQVRLCGAGFLGVSLWIAYDLLSH